MNEPIELTFESPDGIVDCRLEPMRSDDELSYSATILYPNVVNGFPRSEVYCLHLRRGTKMGDYYFENGSDAILPKIKQLENQISKAIVNAAKQSTNQSIN